MICYALTVQRVKRLILMRSSRVLFLFDRSSFRLFLDDSFVWRSSVWEKRFVVLRDNSANRGNTEDFCVLLKQFEQDSILCEDDRTFLIKGRAERICD